MIFHKIKNFIFLLLLCFIGMSFDVHATETTDDPIVIVIDPGHGGENEGANYNGYVEKEMTPIVAQAMVEELSKYEGIKIYLTHDKDVDMSLQERVDVADEVNADFFFCLHFNMSENHALYGAETWISAYGNQYAKAYDFSVIEMEMLSDMGLFDRGIKTRMKGDKSKDYYGVIRCATEVGIPSVIIEHCHVDHDMDAPFLDHYDKLVEYGKLDATAVAKYFQLKSDELGVDYSDYPVSKTQIPTDVMYPDETEPDTCEINLLATDEENGTATFRVNAYDAESRINYYAYSVNDGIIYTERLPWDKDAKSMDITVPMDFSVSNNVTFIAYNMYEKEKVSNKVHLDPTIFPEDTNGDVSDTSNTDGLWTDENSVQTGSDMNSPDDYTTIEYDALGEDNPSLFDRIVYETNIVEYTLIVLFLFISLFMAYLLCKLFVRTNKKDKKQ